MKLLVLLCAMAGLALICVFPPAGAGLLLFAIVLALCSGGGKKYKSFRLS